ncbi:MAG: BatD family protein [Pirellulaceae bacterium]|nr:BatD family protein [Pirellulaceae bacterium]
MKSLIASIAIAMTTLFVCSASAAQVEARLSSREAYVGTPITLQISIADASDYQQPTIPEIDGCDIRSAGRPSQSSQVTIVNGRRSESHSVTMRYLITPRRPGSFEIPSIEVQADGKTTKIPPQQFVVTKSVTGDLLFVEIEGNKDKVFVGQPLDLTLKIWIKPYRDRERELVLSEEDMWKMLSKQTSWGGFAARMQELAENGQRPGGQEVLRDNGQGEQRSYYLYEIPATVYPKRPGKIDADDVQIVVNYPTKLGQSRSPFGSLFEDSPFGSGSPFSGMMNDDFFGSPFGNRLAVTASRPVVGDVSVGSTQVVPVPLEGRPNDYRGAVGRYRIVTHATPATVDAGDPITLDIGIAGSGPMEFVQAPPLNELTGLVADFKVADESLAGFVQDDAKVFSTTIRPRREGITEIPAIPFSFFDPDTEKYVTVKSDPLSITVNKSETLALDAIVGNARGNKSSADSAAATSANALPDFTNDNSPSVLISRPLASHTPWWVSFVIVPPVIWLITWCFQHRAAIASRLPSLRSARSRCLVAIERAANGDDLADALIGYISRRSGQVCSTTTQAMGILRVAGLTSVANEVESFLCILQRSTAVHGRGLSHSNPDIQVENNFELQKDPVETTELARARDHAITLVDRIESDWAAQGTSRVKLPRKHFANNAIPPVAKRSLGLLLAAALACCSTCSIAGEPVTLSNAQQATLLNEAGATYTKATELAQTDSAAAKELFQTAAGKYQLLVDSGIQNGSLYTDLGNAYLQSGELGHAIVNYERALQFEPSNRQVAINLQFANKQVEGQESLPTTMAATSLESYLQKIRFVNATLVQFVGRRSVIWTLAISSLLFWGLWIARTLGASIPVWRIATVPALLLVVSLSSLILTETSSPSPYRAIIVNNNVRLHSGDGEQFDEVFSIDAAQGHRVEVLARRGSWTQIRTIEGHTGWIPAHAVESFAMSS